MGGLEHAGRLQRAAQVEALGRGEQLDGQHVAHVIVHLGQLERGGGAHRHVVLAAGRRRDRIDRRRVGQDLVLGHQRGGRDLGDHEAGVQAALGRQERRQPARHVRVDQLLDPPLADAGQLGHRRGRGVERQRHRLAVEVAARQDLAAVGRAGVDEDQRVVGRGAGLALEHAAGERQHVARRAVHLRHAAQRVRVLDLAAVAVRLGDVALGQQATEERARRHLARLRSRRQDALVERAHRPLERLERHGAGDVGHQAGLLGVEHGQPADRGHVLGAVEQGEAFLGLELERGELGAGQPHRRRHDLAVQLDLALAYHAERQVSQRRQIAGRADRAARRDHRVDARRQHPAQELGHLGTGAGVAAGEDRGPQEHHPAHRVARQRRAQAARVRADQVLLQRADLGRRDAHLGQGAEAGVDAVDRRGRRAAGQHGLDDRARGGHAGAGRRGDAHGSAAPSHRIDPLEGQLVLAEDHIRNRLALTRHRAAIPAVIPGGQDVHAQALRLAIPARRVDREGIAGRYNIVLFERYEWPRRSGTRTPTGRLRGGPDERDASATRASYRPVCARRALARAGRTTTTTASRSRASTSIWTWTTTTVNRQARRPARR